MQLNRRHLASISLAVLAAAIDTTDCHAAASETDAVAAALDTYRTGLLTANGKVFDALFSDPIAYGHSTGGVQTRKAVIDEAGNGKSNWKSITFTELTIQLNGTNAMARCVFNGEQEVNGKQNSPRFGLLTVWVKRGGKWKLLARQGYKI
jgi:hypothetical protein